MNERTNKEGACTQPGGGVKETIQEGQGIKHGTLMTFRGMAVDVEQQARWHRLCLRETPAWAHPPCDTCPGYLRSTAPMPLGCGARGRVLGQPTVRRQGADSQFGWCWCTAWRAAVTWTDAIRSVSLLLAVFRPGLDWD